MRLPREAVERPWLWLDYVAWLAGLTTLVVGLVQNRGLSPLLLVAVFAYGVSGSIRTLKGERLSAGGGDAARIRRRIHTILSLLVLVVSFSYLTLWVMSG